MSSRSEPSSTRPLRTHRLELAPISLAVVEAVMLGRREDAESILDAKMPGRWPNRELIERAFTSSLDDIRAQPDARLWGSRVMIALPEDPATQPLGLDAACRDAGARRVVGSVVFRGLPAAGIAEIAYGVDEDSQGQGYATEAVGACLDWALSQPGVHAVQATTFAWHRPSLRVIEKVGMQRAGTREHELLGEMLLFERRRDGDRAPWSTP